MRRTHGSSALAILFAINTLNFFDRQVLGAVAEPIRREWDLGDGAIGILGTAFTIFYAIAGLPLGRLADRFSRTRILAAGVFAWSILTAASGLARNFLELFVARLGMGAGEATCAPAASSLIGDMFPPERRGRALSVFMLGLPVGLALSYFVSGYISKAHGWRAAFVVAGLPGLVLALAVLSIREPVRGAAEQFQEAAPAGRGSPYRAVLSIPTMWWLIASGALHNFNFTALYTFLSPFLMRCHGLGVDEANYRAALAGLSGVPGLILGGIAADLLRRRRADGRLLAGAAAVIASVPLTFLALTQPRGEIVLFLVLMTAGSGLLYVYYSAVYATVQDVVAPRLRGTAMALYFFAMYVLGAALGPAVVGGLSDRFARGAALAAGIAPTEEDALEPFRAEALRSALLVLPVLSILLALVLFASSRTVARDMERRTRGE
jgi:predicted MFS family arabinose efflux permease